MKKIVSFIFLIALLFSGCQKESGESYTLKSYGDVFEDIGYSVAIASDGYIIAGQFESVKRENGMIVDGSASRNIAVIKTDWQGNVKWKSSLGGKNEDYCSRIYPLDDASMLCVGTFTDTTTSNFEKEIFIARLSSAGEVLWQKRYGGPGNQEGKDLVSTSYGYMVLGSTDVSGDSDNADSLRNDKGNSDVFMLKINNNGDSLFCFPVGFKGNDVPAAIKGFDGDNCIVLATTEQSWKGQDKRNLFMFQVYSSGFSTGPNKIIGTTADEYASDIEVIQDGYLIAGTSGSIGTDQKAYVVRVKRDFTASEAIVYSKKFTINNSSTAINAIAPYGSDNFVLGGYSGLSNASDMLVFEMDKDGNLPEGKYMIIGSSGAQVINDVASGDDGYVIGVGNNRYDINSMISFLKFKF